MSPDPTAAYRKQQEERAERKREQACLRSARWRAEHPDRFRATNRRYYEANREECLAKRSEIKKRKAIKHKAIMSEYKASFGCCVCGESDPRCLDFHHKDSSQKTFEVSHKYHLVLEKLWAEVEKCIVLCANCHRKLHSDGS